MSVTTFPTWREAMESLRPRVAAMSGGMFERAELIQDGVATVPRWTPLWTPDSTTRTRL